MSLLLCRQEPVTAPYYVEALGVHLYSSQELCYVIFHHPLLVMEDFVDERLTAFLRSELRMPFLAERIEKWLESRGLDDPVDAAGDANQRLERMPLSAASGRRDHSA